jgi:hypothetical protein
MASHCENKAQEETVVAQADASSNPGAVMVESFHAVVAIACDNNNKQTYTTKTNKKTKQKGPNIRRRKR